MSLMSVGGISPPLLVFYRWSYNKPKLFSNFDFQAEGTLRGLVYI